MLKHVIDLVDLLDSPVVTGDDVAGYLHKFAPPSECDIEVTPVCGERGTTDFVRVRVPGRQGKTNGGSAPTLGVIGRLGGVGARPELLGFVSDGDGAVAALSVAAKLLSMAVRGDHLAGDVIVATHVCPDAPTEAHDPVPFMGSPVDMAVMNLHEIDAHAMDAVVSIDTTKGNRITNHRGLALSPTVKEGCILRVSSRLGELLEWVTGRPLVTFPLAMQDITPYGNGLHHLNSILQPATATPAPVVGLAICSAAAVPGCATGVSHETDIAAAARFAIEVAKEFGASRLSFYDKGEFELFQRRYGSMSHLQTPGRREG